MYGYNTGNNEGNDHEVKKRIDTIHRKISRKSTRLSRAPTVDFNHQMLKKKHTLQVDLDKMSEKKQKNFSKIMALVQKKMIYCSKSKVFLYLEYIAIFLNVSIGFSLFLL